MKVEFTRNAALLSGCYQLVQILRGTESRFAHFSNPFRTEKQSKLATSKMHSHPHTHTNTHTQTRARARAHKLRSLPFILYKFAATVELVFLLARCVQD